MSARFGMRLDEAKRFAVLDEFSKVRNRRALITRAVQYGPEYVRYERLGM